MQRAIRVLVVALLVLQVAYFATNLGSFNFGAQSYLEAPIGTLLWLYAMLVITVALIFVLVVYKQR
jgi:hypothetical protein